MLKHLANNHIKPKHNLIIIISTYEEVGHGSSYIHPNIGELIAVDMGCIGEDLACSEYDVALRGGQNIKGALIGPGVAASHGMERTHLQAVENTLKLLLAYIA